MINAIGGDKTKSTTLELGVRYPSCMLTLNPPSRLVGSETTSTFE